MENTENYTENKKPFLAGLGLGAIGGMIIVIIVMTGINVHARQTRWNGIDPNTKIMEIYNYLRNNSIVEFDKNFMLDNMYRGFLAGVGDPYTQYLCLQTFAAFRARNEGFLVGIGITIFVEPNDPFVTIADTFRGAPAEAAGILPGDQIVAIDGVDVAGWQREDVVGAITGVEGTPVEITIFRPYEGERFDVRIYRARIEVPSVFHEMLYTDTGAVGYIQLTGFDERTPSQFDAAVAELYAGGMGGLILDLRNNPGGSLQSVIAITNRLIPEGIIVYTLDANGRRRNSYADANYLGLPLVVLVNERSASASEVLSGAVRDTEMGILVGTQTFGKGVVQSIIELSDGTAIKMTIQTYHTPNGECIDGVGITPHVIVGMADSLSRMVGTLPIEDDVQLQTALEVIEGKF